MTMVKMRRLYGWALMNEDGRICCVRANAKEVKDYPLRQQNERTVPIITISLAEYRDLKRKAREFPR